MINKCSMSRYNKLFTVIFVFTFVFIQVHGQIDTNLTAKLSKRAQITNLPSFYITTAGSVVSKDINVKGKLYIAGADTLKNDSIEIRGRGNGTWNWAKKPYRIKLYSKANLLGMPAKDKTWPILAHYADKSLIRNALALKISTLCDIYFSPSFRFVDVVLNSDFIGNYLVTDQVEVSGDRVDITKQKSTDINLPEIEGGYLLEIDGYANYSSIEPGASFPEGFLSINNTPVSIKYPKDDEINQQQRNYIINYFNKFETLILNYKKGDSLDSIRKYLDIDAMINWYIACELTANPDCFWSMYLMKDRGKTQFTFGPMWDYDIAFANDRRLGDTRNELMLYHAHQFGSIPKALKRLFTCPEINERLRNRWVEIRDKQLRGCISSFIDSTRTLLDASQKLNYERWPTLNTITHLELTTRGSFEAEVSFVQTFMMDHINSLDSIFSNFEEMSKSFEIDENKWYTLTNFLNDKALDLKDSLSDDLTPTVLWSVKDGPLESQLFRFTATGNGSYMITNKYSDKMLEAYRKTEDGGIPSATPSYYLLCINQFQYHNLSQEWKLEERQFGVYSLINVYSGMAIDNYSTSTKDGNTIGMWTADANNGNQQWRFNERGYVNPVTTGKKPVTEKISLYVTPGEVHIENNGTIKLCISDMTGHILIQRVVTESSYKVSLPSGLYIITMNDSVRKFAIP